MLKILMLLLALPGFVMADENIKTIWSSNLDNQFRMTGDAAVAVCDGNIYCGNGEINLMTGKVIRHFASEYFGNDIKQIKFSAGAVIFASQSTGNEEESDCSYEYCWNAFDMKTGKLLWETTQASADCRNWAPVLLETCGDIALLAKGKNHDELNAVDARSGKILWQLKFGSIVNLAVSGNGVFLRAGKYVMALSAVNGKILWKTALPDSTLQLMELGKSQVYISGKSDEDSYLISINQQTGKTIWKKDFPKGDLFQPVELKGTLFFISQPEKDFMPGFLLALDAESGRETWRIQAVADFNGWDFQPKIFKDKLIMWSGDAKYLENSGSSGDVKLFCIDPADGKKKWDYLPAKTLQYSLLVCGDYIIIKDNDAMRCLHTGDVK